LSTFVNDILLQTLVAKYASHAIINTKLVVISHDLLLPGKGNYHDNSQLESNRARTPVDLEITNNNIEAL